MSSVSQSVVLDGTPWWEAILINAGGAMLAAAFATCVVAQFKAWRIRSRLLEIADALRGIRVNALKGRRRNEQFVQISEELNQLSSKLLAEAAGALKPTKKFRTDVERLRSEIEEAKLKSTIGAVVTAVTEGKETNMSKDAENKIASLEHDFRTMASRLRVSRGGFWQFVRP